MARDARIEARLQRWAEWVDVGDASGYPTMSVLHPSWMPPSGGLTPTLKVAASTDVRETHRCIGHLSTRLANTVVVHYLLKLPLVEQAKMLECAEVTVHARIDQVHRQLRAALLADSTSGFAT